MPVQRDWISLALPLCLCLPSAGALHHPFLLKVRDNSLLASFEGAARERLHTCTLPCQGRKDAAGGKRQEGDKAKGKGYTVRGTSLPVFFPHVQEEKRPYSPGDIPGPHGLTFSKGFFKRAAKRLKEVLFS